MSCRVVIPLDFELINTGIIHGLAFWFEIGFMGTRYVISVVSMSLTILLLPSSFVQCHSMAVYCSTPAINTLVSGMMQYLCELSHYLCGHMYENLFCSASQSSTGI